MSSVKQSLLDLFFNKHQKKALSNLWLEYKISKYHRKGIKKINKLNLHKSPKINLGSGDKLKSGFLNIDLFPGPDVTLDLRNPLPFESNSCEIIISEHFFEHLEYPLAVTELLSECYRILKPGGILRFSVPDTEWPIKAYSIGYNSDYFRACKDNSWWHPNCETMMEHINYHFRQNGEHRFAYDYETATKILIKAGFVRIRRDAFDPSLDSTHREIGSLFIVGEKD